MLTCPTCGTRNPPGQTSCRACGSEFGQAAPSLPTTQRAVQPAQRKSSVKHTMVGVAPPAQGAPQPQAARAASDRKSKQTMIGVAPPAQGAQAPLEDIERTHLSATNPAEHASPQRPVLVEVPPARGLPGNPPQDADQLEATVPSVTPPPQVTVKSKHKTKVGIAHPGIAPLQPNIAKPNSPGQAPSDQAPPAQAPPGQSNDLFAPTPLTAERIPTTTKSPSQAPTLISGEANSREQARARSLRVAAITIVTVAVLLGVVIVTLAVVIRARGPVQAQIALDEQGDQQLALECRGCDDGTAVRVGGVESTFANHQAVVALTRDLQIGDNEFTITLRHPDGRAEDVDLVVPVNYRLSTDLSGLASNPPTVRVNVAAAPDTAVVIDGQPVTLDGSGKGTASVDVSQSLTGPATAITRLDRKIAYTVSRRRADPESGELTVRIGIAPLIVDAPGSSITIDTANFWLAGRTLKGGSVNVGGRPITVDPEGRFAQLMNVSSVGETTIFIRAEADQHAPRLVPLRVRRVTSLAEEAKRLSPTATRSYPKILSTMNSPEQPLVLLEGAVSQVRTQSHTTVFIVGVQPGCDQALCLARVRYGAEFTAQQGDQVRVFGQLIGAVEWQGAKIPEVRAEFVLSESKP